MKIIKVTFTASLRGQRTSISDDYVYQFDDDESDTEIEQALNEYYNEWIANINNGGYTINDITHTEG